MESGLVLLEPAGDVPGLHVVEEGLAVDAFLLLLLLRILSILSILSILRCCCSFLGEETTEKIGQSFLSGAATTIEMVDLTG